MQNLYSTLIIDDEPLARERLETMLLNFSETIKIVGFAKNGNDALEQIKNLQPDLIFLDIEMPLLNGFQLIEKLNKIPLIIFCTAHDEYALQAFETNSIDYLVKPVRVERIEKTINKLKQLTQPQNSQDILEVIKQLNTVNDNKRMTSITVKKGDSITFIKLDDVCYFEAKDKYVNITTDKGTYLTEKTLTQLENQLPDFFFRVHRSFVINTNYVLEVNKHFNSRYIIKLNNKKLTQITTGRSYLNAIKDWVGL